MKAIFGIFVWFVLVLVVGGCQSVADYEKEHPETVNPPGTTPPPVPVDSRLPSYTGPATFSCIINTTGMQSHSLPTSDNTVEFWTIGDLPPGLSTEWGDWTRGGHFTARWVGIPRVVGVYPVTLVLRNSFGETRSVVTVTIRPKESQGLLVDQ